MVEGTMGSHRKEGATKKMSKTSTIAAGIDVAKAKLDIAVHGCNERWQVVNAPAGFRELVRLMHRHKVARIAAPSGAGLSPVHPVSGQERSYRRGSDRRLHGPS
jgi:hypothetical protein